MVAEACLEAKKEAVALSLSSKAVKLDPNSLRGNFNLASIYLAKGDFELALPRLERLHRLNPAAQPILIALARTYLQLKRPVEAAECFRALRSQGPISSDLLWEFAKHLTEAGQFSDVAMCLSDVLTSHPDHVPTLNDLGVALIQSGRAADSVPYFERIIRIDPSQIPARINLSAVLKQLGRYEEALSHLESAKTLMPTTATIRASIAQTLVLNEQFEIAEQECLEGLQLEPASGELHHHLAMAMRGLRRHGEAMSHFEVAAATQPRNYSLLLNMGNTALEMGDLSLAEETFKRLVEVAPQVGSHHRSLASVHRYSIDDPHIAVMERCLRSESSREQDPIDLHFALAKAYDNIGQYETAFSHLKLGNDLYRRTITYDEGRAVELFDLLQRSISKQSLLPSAGSSALSDRPIFIVGMPRSGTSLVEQVLACHPEVAALGERSDWPTCLDAAPGGISQIQYELKDEWLTNLGNAYLLSTQADSVNRSRSVDKMPSNFIYSGLIHLALPNAKILHLKRNPLDTCVSIYTQLFSGIQGFAYDLGELGRYYRRYERIMEHWRFELPASSFLEVEYESMVEDFETHARQILEFCGLPWNDACLNFHESTSVVLTASAAQVRRPIYTTAVRRSDHYAPFLAPLSEALNGRTA